MKIKLSASFRSLCISLLALSAAYSLETRDGNETDNARFTGFPSNPSINPNYAYSSFDFTGVGWYVQDTRRQFALVSPQHFVCARHFAPSTNGQVRFLGSNGVVYTHEILKVEVVQNAGDENTDLAIGTLETPVNTEFITPTKFANLAQDASYAGPGLVFGRTALTANTTFAGITDFNGNSVSGSAVDDTRMINLSYQSLTGNNNDAFVEVGDSGSPCFLIINNQVGLVGTNSAVLNTPGGQTALSAFVPFYENELNAFMSDEGYRMSPLFPLSTSLFVETLETSTLRQGFAGTINLILSNTGNADAGNVLMVVNNTTGLPDEMTSTRYFSNGNSSSQRQLNTATLSSAAQDTIILNWDKLPFNETLSFDVVTRSDESGSVTRTVILNLLPSFSGFTNGLTDQSESGDDDGDQVVNLLEYAFGGNPEVASREAVEGIALLPTIINTFSSPQFQFLRRIDAADRALTYTLESSTTLKENSWSEVELDDASVELIEGTDLERVLLDLDLVSDTRRFYRMQINLSE